MFREMRRIKQQVSEEECLRILKTERRGALAMIGEEGYPYAIPVNYYYDENDGKIWIHGAKEGHKIDVLKSCGKVCFTVWEQGKLKEDDPFYWVTSVVIRGTAELVEDQETAYRHLRQVGLKYYPSAEYTDEVMARSASRVQMIAVTIDHMTGKLVHEK